MKITIDPIITFAASKNGVNDPAFDIKLTAIKGAHEPIMSPPL
jgi:hypothetical protein